MSCTATEAQLRCVNVLLGHAVVLMMYAVSMLYSKLVPLTRWNELQASLKQYSKALKDARKVSRHTWLTPLLMCEEQSAPTLFDTHT